jgi:hypothetical protein
MAHYLVFNLSFVRIFFMPGLQKTVWNLGAHSYFVHMPREWQTSRFHVLKEQTCSPDGVGCRHERNFLLQETEWMKVVIFCKNNSSSFASGLSCDAVRGLKPKTYTLFISWIMPEMNCWCWLVVLRCGVGGWTLRGATFYSGRIQCCQSSCLTMSFTHLWFPKAF